MQRVGGGEREKGMEGGREGGRQPCEEPCEWKGKKKSGQRLQGEGLERSRVCSVYEETGQGVRLRNSLQWLSQRHVDHHVLPPSLLTLTLLSAHCLSLPPLPPPRVVSVHRVLSAQPSYSSVRLSLPTRALVSCFARVMPGALTGPARERDPQQPQCRDVLALTAALHLFLAVR